MKRKFTDVDCGFDPTQSQHLLMLPYGDDALTGVQQGLLLRRLSCFIESIMQQDVYMGYTALTLTLGLQVFSNWGHHCLALPPVCHIKLEASR